MKKRELPNCIVFLYCPYYYLEPLPFSLSQVPSDRQESSVVKSSLSLLRCDLAQPSLGSNSNYPGEATE